MSNPRVPELSQVGSRAGARTIGEGGNSIAFAMDRSPAAMVAFPAPPRQTQSAVFLQCAFLFASCQDLLRWERFLRRPATHLIAVEQLQVLVPVAPTPRLPAKTSPIPGSSFDAGFYFLPSL